LENLYITAKSLWVCHSVLTFPKFKRPPGKFYTKTFAKHRRRDENLTLRLDPFHSSHKGTSRTIELYGSRWKFAEAFERLRNMLELKIRCRYSQAPLQRSVIVGTSTSPLTMWLILHRWGGRGGPTLALCCRGAGEYRHLILSSSTFLSLSNASANFQRDLKFDGRRGSLVSFCATLKHERQKKWSRGWTDRVPMIVLTILPSCRSRSWRSTRHFCLRVCETHFITWNSAFRAKNQI